MVEIAKKYNMNEMNIKNCFVIGISHDIGYEFSLNKSEHNRIDGKILKETGFQFIWKWWFYKSPHFGNTITMRRVFDKNTLFWYNLLVFILY